MKLKLVLGISFDNEVWLLKLFTCSQKFSQNSTLVKCIKWWCSLMASFIKVAQWLKFQFPNIWRSRNLKNRQIQFFSSPNHIWKKKSKNKLLISPNIRETWQDKKNYYQKDNFPFLTRTLQKEQIIAHKKLRIKNHFEVTFLKAGCFSSMVISNSSAVISSDLKRSNNNNNKKDEKMSSLKLNL